MSVEEWRQEIADDKVKSCGRLDMQTYMPTEVTLGRVTSDRVRYVYFEDGSECIVLGKLCDHVAFRAADYDAAVAAAEARGRRAAFAEAYKHYKECGDVLWSSDPKRVPFKEWLKARAAGEGE